MTLDDMRPGWFPRQATKNVVVVAIDSPSLQKIGHWPWPRSLHAKLIEKLITAGARDIAFDVDFSSPSSRSSDDDFLNALTRAGGSVLLPAFKQPVGSGKGQERYFINRPLVRFRDEAWTALVNVRAEWDGAVRRYPYGARLDAGYIPSMASLLAGGKANRDQSFWIDLSIRPNTIPVVSYVDVLQDNPSALELLRGKKVIIGGTALELGDHFMLPRGRPISGPLLQALAAETILQGRDLHRGSWLFGLSAVAALIFVMVLAWRRVPAWARVALLLSLAIIAETTATIVQAKLPVIIDTSLLHVAIGAYLIAIALDEVGLRGMLSKIAESRFQRIAMSLGDGVLCANTDGLITLWNGGAAAIFGYDSKEMFGRPIETVLAARSEATFSITQLPQIELKAPGGKILEIEGRRKNGEIFPLEACFSGWEGVDGFQYGAVLRDISVRKKEADRIRYLAEFDTLTGLANRHTLHQHLCAELSEADATRSKIALVLLDLDTFKQINDTLGHSYGDQILVAVAKQLNNLLAGSGLAARLGGDEFAIVVTGDGVVDRAQDLCARVIAAFRELPVDARGRDLLVKASIGVAIYPDDGSSGEELLGSADLALYHAKAQGRGRYVFFDRKLRTELEARVSLEAELKRAVQNGEFELFYQPQVDLRERTVVGAEALIRWRHPERGLISPAEFMPIINSSSLSNDVGVWVIHTACTQGYRWQKKGYDLRIGVNLSPGQIQSGDLSPVVSSILAETGFSPSLLELEVTEDSVIIDEERSLRNFREIQALGVRLAFDDFGTGYASLSYLKKFPLDVLKIDRSFVQGLRPSTEDAAIVEATIGLSKQLGLSVIAEGIEDAGTAEFLRMMGCHEGQGYFFGRPVPASDFEQKFLSQEGVIPTPAAANAAA